MIINQEYLLIEKGSSNKLEKQLNKIANDYEENIIIQIISFIHIKLYNS